ncbi:PAS domain-containing protein [Melittangium boletus]|uniref:PAS domain-containing protein n=1 Tax=Melittangium boletus DSM 14713 TaxID=1294270 RepID=A0A250II60_9BACT|nr:PAS domain-containing protein [Melittangium boletus]ATB30958.1 hypothetical protein MEBOL_004420 [Melittangium boletus DSM 14713]
MFPPRGLYALEAFNPDAFLALRLEATGDSEDFLCEYANPAVEALLEENPLGRRLRSRWPELAEGLSAWSQVLATGEPHTRVLLMRRGSGTRRVLARAARVEAGLLAVWLADVTDTERFVSETAAFEERMLSFVECMPTPFLALDPRCRFVYVNRAAEQLLGKRRQALMGRTLEQESTGSPSSALGTQIRRVLTSGTPVAFEERFHSRWWEVTVAPTVDGLLVYLHDITAHRRPSTVPLASRTRLGRSIGGACGKRYRRHR